jgi:cytidylate kinase
MSGGFIIAVDGVAASGKGTIAQMLAGVYGLPYLDTGLLYRAVGLAVLRQGGDPNDAEVATAAALSLDLSKLDDPALRSLEAGLAASRVGPHPQVRAALRQVQRVFAAQSPGAVLDGRDIGTVIVPDAPAKLYVVASLAVRADRRWRQLQAKGEGVTLEQVIADISQRDASDGGRKDSPMRPADDAVLLDTTEMTIDQAADAARRVVETARGRWAQSQAG